MIRQGPVPGVDGEVPDRRGATPSPGTEKLGFDHGRDPRRPRGTRDGNGAIAPDAGKLAEARSKLAAALRAFSAAQSAVPSLAAAPAAGAALPPDHLFELATVRSFPA